MRIFTLGAVFCVVIAALGWAAPAEATGCYALCEESYYYCILSGGTSCSSTLEICTLSCGGSGGGGGTVRPGFPDRTCVAACRTSYIDCLVTGPPPGTTLTCAEIQTSCIDDC